MPSPRTLAWLGVAAHLCVVVVALSWRAERSPHRLLALLNLAIAICVLAYWAQVWYGYVARGITWYATDQLLPLYAIAVAVASGLALTGRFVGRLAFGIQWFVFAVDAIVFIAAALYLTFARFDRLI